MSDIVDRLEQLKADLVMRRERMKKTLELIDSDLALFDEMLSLYRDSLMLHEERNILEEGNILLQTEIDQLRAQLRDSKKE